MIGSTQINRVRGDTYADSFQITFSNTGAPVDLTGCSFTMTVNKEKNPTNTDLQLYQVVGTIFDPLSGTVDFIPNSSQVDNVGLFYYDIQMIDGNGIKRTLVKDVYNYTEDITKN